MSQQLVVKSRCSAFDRGEMMMGDEAKRGEKDHSNKKEYTNYCFMEIK